MPSLPQCTDACRLLCRRRRLASLRAFANPDGSVDIYFGPKPPAGEGRNWIQTVPGKGPYVILCVYSPLEPFLTKPGGRARIQLVP